MRLGCLWGQLPQPDYGLPVGKIGSSEIYSFAPRGIEERPGLRAKGCEPSYREGYRARSA